MNDEPKTGGPKPRNVLYSEAAAHASRAIEVLVEIMNKGDSDSNRVGAAKTLLAKAIPDLKAMEIMGQDGQPIKFVVVTEGNNGQSTPHIRLVPGTDPAVAGESQG